jgi:hypothetical protein
MYSSNGVVVISLEVGDCWLWSLIIFLIHMQVFLDPFFGGFWGWPLNERGMGGTQPLARGHGEKQGQGETDFLLSFIFTLGMKVKMINFPDPRWIIVHGVQH